MIDTGTTASFIYFDGVLAEREPISLLHSEPISSLSHCASLTCPLPHISLYARPHEVTTQVNCFFNPPRPASYRVDHSNIRFPSSCLRTSPDARQCTHAVNPVESKCLDSFSLQPPLSTVPLCGIKPSTDHGRRLEICLPMTRRLSHCSSDIRT